jgi:hypothetical protein
VKNNNVKKGIFTALLLASPFVTAGVKYPAADFQPKVVYQDKDYQHESSSSAESSASFGETAKADSNYPAATFKPEVLYHDKSYKHSTSIEKTKSLPLTAWTEEAEETVAETQTSVDTSSDDSAINPLFAIVILAVAAFLFRQKADSGSAKNNKGASTASTDGLTGVAKYLQNKTPKLSGVARYIEENQPAPKSGVAKYVAKKVVAAKKAAAENVSGVEKYVRRKG